jgi:hypothetical protein
MGRGYPVHEGTDSLIGECCPQESPGMPDGHAQAEHDQREQPVGERSRTRLAVIGQISTGRLVQRLIEAALVGKEGSAARRMRTGCQRVCPSAAPARSSAIDPGWSPRTRRSGWPARRTARHSSSSRLGVSRVSPDCRQPEPPGTRLRPRLGPGGAAAELHSPRASAP